MIKNIFFDLDNTLIDFMKFKRRTADAAARAMVRNGLKKDWKKISRDIFRIYDEYGIEYQKTFSKLLIKYRIKDKDRFEKIQHAGIVAYLKTKFEVLKPYPKTKQTLRKLRKKYKVHLLTDAPRNKAWQRLVVCGLQNEFDRVITLDDSGALKHTGLPFRTAVRMLKIKPKESVMVGDSINRDIRPAKKLGFVTVLAKYGKSNEKGKADYEINDISQLLKIL